MYFLIIVLVVLIDRFSDVFDIVHRDDWFDSLVAKCRGFESLHPLAPFLVAVLIPVVLLLVLLGVFHDSYLVLLLINLFVLAYVVGRCDWRSEILRLMESLRRGDRESVILKLNLIAPGLAEKNLDDNEDVWLQVRNTLLYRHIESYYAVVFWFFVLGAPAALIYRLVFLYVQKNEQQIQNNKVDGEGVLDSVKLLWLLEWLPVRLVGLLFCLAGNFSSGLPKWRDCLTDAEASTEKTLGDCAEAAMFANFQGAVADVSVSTAKRVDAVALEKEELQEVLNKTNGLQELMQRTEVVFLAALAVITLI